jgi:hypothetical protein
MTHDPHTDALITDALVAAFGIEVSIVVAFVLKTLLAIHKTMKERKQQ